MHRHRFLARVRTTAAALGLMGTILLPGSVAAAPSGPWLAGIRASEGLHGPVLVAGQLIGRSGEARSGRITAIAWPRMDVLGALKVGDAVHTTPVGKATAAADGRFVLRIDPALPIGEFMEDDGTVNFDIVATDGTERSLVSLSRRFDAGHGNWLDPARNDQAADVSADAATLTFGAIGSSNDNGVPLPSPASNKIFPCPDYVEAQYDQVPVAIGETYPGPHASAQFIYSSGSSSTLGVGFSVSGSYGSFSASGTTSSSSTSTLQWPSKGANSMFIYKTTFQYKKFDEYVWDGYFCDHWGREVRPTAFQGAVNGYNACCAPGVSYCSSITQVPSTITKYTARAVTWSDAVTLAGSIGINLSGSTGYTSSTEVKLSYTQTGSLCGDTAARPDAHRIVGR